MYKNEVMLKLINNSQFSDTDLIELQILFEDWTMKFNEDNIFRENS